MQAIKKQATLFQKHKKRRMQIKKGNSIFYPFSNEGLCDQRLRVLSIPMSKLHKTKLTVLKHCVKHAGFLLPLYSHVRKDFRNCFYTGIYGSEEAGILAYFTQ